MDNNDFEKYIEDNNLTYDVVVINLEGYPRAVYGLEERVKVLEDMLVENYKTFCHYGKLHAAKDTESGSKKAHANLDIAEKIRKTLGRALTTP